MSEVDNSKLDLYNLRDHSDFYHTIKYFDVTAKTNEVCKKKSNDVVKKLKILKIL